MVRLEYSTGYRYYTCRPHQTTCGLDS